MQVNNSWVSEKESAYLYRLLAEREPSADIRHLFEQLAAAAESQAQRWTEIAAEQGGRVPAQFRPSARTRLVGMLIKWLGPRRMLPVLAAMKVRGVSAYTHRYAGAHATAASAAAEKRHVGLNSGGNFRAAIFGINDGLVSNASLIMGVAGAALSQHWLLLTGFAGLLAGAASMAAGEYVSMRSQREMFEYQIGLERDELATYPEEEASELALIYQARGLSPADAQRMAAVVIANPAHALDALAREELGLNPEELGSPWGAASSSFVAFSIGALVPLLPFFWGNAATGLIVAVLLTLAALFCVGAAASLFTGRSMLWSGARMMLVGAIAGGATFCLGRLFGIAIG